MRQRKLDFSVILNMTLVHKKSGVSVLIKGVKVKPSTVQLPIEVKTKEKKSKTRNKLGKPIHDIVLESAKTLSKKAGEGVFSSVDLFNVAIKKHPDLNKKSFSTYVISAAPEHTSWKHYKNGKDYLVYLGKGKYKLRESAE
jgi:hypothetical protein